MLTLTGMGMDSVEIVLAWEESFGISIPDSETMPLFTPRQAIDLLAQKLNACDISGPCLTLRAFHRLRRAFMAVAGIDRHRIRPQSRLRDLIPRRDHHSWQAMRARSGFASLPAPGLFSITTLTDLLDWSVTHAAKDLKPATEPWTRAEVRQVIRAAITETVGAKNFSDDDRFIEDIGVC